MYGNEPSRWTTPAGADRLRCVINALTRVRFVAAPTARWTSCTKDGIDGHAGGHTPWFDHPARATRGTPIVFGHWSTLGLLLRDDVMCLDSGCVWGGKLTALHWP